MEEARIIGGLGAQLKEKYKKGKREDSKLGTFFLGKSLAELIRGNTRSENTS